LNKRTTNRCETSNDCYCYLWLSLLATPFYYFLQESRLALRFPCCYLGGSKMESLLPPPGGQVLSLISALSNTSNHDLHVQAIRARDDALSSSPESYGNLCVQLGYLLVGSDRPGQLLSRIDPAHMEQWKQTDMSSALRLQQDESMWIPFGQMAGLVLKNALLHPPIMIDMRPLSLMPPQADDVKSTLLACLSCQHAELRAVASSVIATCSVSADGVQPALHIQAWPQLVPQLVHNLQPQAQASQATIEGSLTTVRKMLEDGPRELSQESLDALVPLLLRFLGSPDERSKVSALQSLVACHSDDMMPSALVMHFSDYLASLSALATDASPLVRKWVCRSIVTLLELRTEYVQDHIGPISQFMMQQTSLDPNAPSSATTSASAVALEACEFWLTFANLDDDACPTAMVETVGSLLPQLIPILLQNMVYLPEQRIELQAQNELDMEAHQAGGMKPVFHKARNKHGGGAHKHDDDDSEGGSDEDGDDFDDDEGNEWTLRKCAAASLDSLSSVYGASAILPPLLPALEHGLGSSDPWVQEASILALGAIADGCREEMNAHMGQLFPYLMNHLAAPESPNNLPQVKSIAAWTIGRYASWAIEQVQTGMQGHLLAQMTEVFIERLKDQNRKVQVACVSAFGVVMETAGDLMAPYLEPVFQGLMGALGRYQGRSLVVLFDTLGIMADFVGPAIAEGHLPSIFVPPLMQMWDGLAKHDPTDRTLLPLLECIASIALTSGTNFQPYALDVFNMAMAMIESVTLLLVTSGERIENDEEADPIICAADVLDGLVEGLGGNFAALVNSSSRYGPQFTTMLHTLCKHEVPGVRMSALALLGDLARNAPSVIEAALPLLLPEAIANADPVQHSVCNNAVWALGEIAVRCGDNPAPLEPFAAPLLQRLIALLMGNGVVMSGSIGSRGVNIPGLAENAAAAAGRLANVNPNFVAPDLPRFLLGWCDGLAKIADPTERRDGFEGFIKAIYANPQCIQSAAANVSDAIASILFALVSWHMPPQEETDHDQVSEILNGDYAFQPFPQHEAELGKKLVQLVCEIRTSVGEDVWTKVQNQLPVNVRRLLREGYNL
jgi:transportin-1